MRTIGVVTAGRSDYGIYLPLLRKIKEDSDLKLQLIVGGMHLSPEFGLTVKAIEADGFEIAARVEMLLSSHTPEGIAKSVGLGIIGFAQCYAQHRPDILVVLGDRFEMYAAAVGALPFKLPVAHIHGGEVTMGAMDDALRHSITKLGHLHFVSTEEYARRAMQLGEEPWRVVVCGALSVDAIYGTRLLSMEELQIRCGVRMKQPFLLVTYHPVTLEYEQTGWQIGELLAALEVVGLPVLFTLPNADTAGRTIIREIQRFVASHPSSQMVANLGSQGYFSVMALAAVMVGNSSSGIVEAGLLKLPVVNIGTRQQGRIREDNVIDVGYEPNEIIMGIKRALTPEFRARLQKISNLYGDGHAAERITSTLKSVAIDDGLIIKHFVDHPLSLVSRTTSAEIDQNKSL